MGTESTRTGTFIHDGRRFHVPQGLCNVDHDAGKTRWQRVAEIFENDGSTFWTSTDPAVDEVSAFWSGYTPPHWEAGRATDLTDWSLGIGVDREYGSSIGPNRWSIWIDIGPFSWWLMREWPATKGQRR